MITTYAPGRAELLGNHTDYNEGLVLSLAISYGTTISADANDAGEINLYAREFDRHWSGKLDNLAPQGRETWANYILGVVAQLRRRGVTVSGFDAEISSTIPIGAGLSSSASLEIATALTVQKLFPYEMSRLDLARVGQAAEHTYAGVKCGLLDQISVALSKQNHATYIDCRAFEISHLPLGADVEFVIAHSGVKHALTAGEYNERRESCEAAARLLGVKALRDVTASGLEAARAKLPGRVYKRAAHVVGENERVTRARDLLANNKMKEFGALMFESHESSIHNFENSCEELDFLVGEARKSPACLGARLSGGGFGGATINLVRRKDADPFCASLSAAYEQQYGKRPLILKTEACAAAE
ncbi:MAG: galactokinase [Verrucomicrobiales bacterium]|jgi:galactokinase|nr:galactokinase [Verrucomicrobiales bacterium]